MASAAASSEKSAPQIRHKKRGRCPLGSGDSGFRFQGEARELPLIVTTRNLNCTSWTSWLRTGILTLRALVMFCIVTSLHVLCFMHSTFLLRRVGEASHPGPTDPWASWLRKPKRQRRSLHAEASQHNLLRRAHRVASQRFDSCMRLTTAADTSCVGTG